MEEAIKQHLLSINRLVHNSLRFGNKYYIIQTGNSCDTPRDILEHLRKHIAGLKQVYSVEECDGILLFCPIVSRARTDMEAALNELNRCSASKPAVFMVLHHTFEREKIVPDSSRFVNRENTLTVNCLFNEDVGLLKCAMNDGALAKIIVHVKDQQATNCLWGIICIVANLLFLLFQTTVCVIVGKVKALTYKEKDKKILHSADTEGYRRRDEDEKKVKKLRL